MIPINLSQPHLKEEIKMSSKKTHNPIQINAEVCVKCNLCDWICPGDLIYKKEDDRKTLPVIKYPDECWYCGLCQSICPVDAIEIIFPEEMINCKTDVRTLLGKPVD